MPQVGWEVDGHLYSIEEAFELGSRYPYFHGLPSPVLNKMRETESSPTTIRASMVGSCIRQAFLRRKHDYHVRPDLKWASLMGTAGHLLFSKQEGEDTEDVLKEFEIAATFRYRDIDFTLSGHPDRYTQSTGVLEDWKLTGSLYKKPDPKHFAQLNFYLYLLRLHGYQPTQAVLWYGEFKTVKKRDTGLTTLNRLPIEVPIWSDDEVEVMLDNLCEVVYQAHVEGVLPPAYTQEHENYYICNFCPVQDICRTLEKEGK